MQLFFCISGKQASLLKLSYLCNLAVQQARSRVEESDEGEAQSSNKDNSEMPVGKTLQAESAITPRLNIYLDAQVNGFLPGHSNSCL